MLWGPLYTPQMMKLGKKQRVKFNHHDPSNDLGDLLKNAQTSSIFELENVFFFKNKSELN